MGSNLAAVSAQTSHIGLCVTDLERSLRFYCEGLGFAKVLAYELDELRGHRDGR